MSVLIYSIDSEFSEFLKESLEFSSINTTVASSFSDAELRLFKGEADIAVFIALDDSILRKILRAIGDFCSVLVIGDSSQRTFVKPSWRFLTMQTTTNVALAVIIDFFEEKSEITLTLVQSSAVLGGPFSTHAETVRETSPVSRSESPEWMEKTRLGTYGLTPSELAQLKNEYKVVDAYEFAYCDALIIRPDNTQKFLSFLSKTQSLITTPIVSLEPSLILEYLATSVIFLNGNFEDPLLMEKIQSLAREMHPRFRANKEDVKTNALLRNLGCIESEPADIVISKHAIPLHENTVFFRNEKSENTEVRNLGPFQSDFENRRVVWEMSSRARQKENSSQGNISYFLKTLSELENPYLLLTYLKPVHSEILFQALLDDYYITSIRNSSGAFLSLCDASELKGLENAFQTLKGWTGRDLYGHGWYPTTFTQIIPVTLASFTSALQQFDKNENQEEFVYLQNEHLVF